MPGELTTALSPWYSAHVRTSGGKPVVVLGSASPRRREILERLGIAHRIVVGRADETVLSGEPAPVYLARVVALKLEAVSAALPADLAGQEPAPALLVADTSVVLEGDILGKPVDVQDARHMIARLSGKTHEVCTRFAIALLPGKEIPEFAHAETVVTRVSFRELLAPEMDAYSRHGEGADKAGGYAIQGLASGFVSRLEGSYTNVVGLPASEVIVALRRLGVLGVGA
jgi:septum formation protein